MKLERSKFSSLVLYYSIYVYNNNLTGVEMLVLLCIFWFIVVE